MKVVLTADVDVPEKYRQHLGRLFKAFLDTLPGSIADTTVASAAVGVPKKKAPANRFVSDRKGKTDAE